MFRVATYNVQNLFARPKVFYESAEKQEVLLAKFGQLQFELSQPKFDRQKINELKRALSGLIEIVDVRGRHTQAKGADSWLGWVRLVGKPSMSLALRNTARVIDSLEADVVGLQEVEDRPTLQRFHDEILAPRFLARRKTKNYKHVLLIDGNDARGIDVGVLSRVPVRCVRSYMHERVTINGKEVPLFSRDCLEVVVNRAGFGNVYIFINHFKSQRTVEGDFLGRKHRLAQAERVAELVNEAYRQSEHVMVIGDLNAPADDVTLAPLLAHKKLYNTSLQLAAEGRGTFRTGKQQLDYVLVSSALRVRMTGVRLEKGGIYTRDKPRFDSVTSRKTQASDHAAVVATFE